MNKKTKYVILGIFVGLAIFFIIPIFPVSFPNTIHTQTTIVWFSGLKVLNMGFGVKDFILHQTIGGLLGFLFPFLIIKNGGKK